MWFQTEGVAPHPMQIHFACPLHCHEIDGSIENSLHDSARRYGHQLRFVHVVGVPVASIVAVLARWVREANQERSLVGILNACTHDIEHRMTHGLHLESLLLILERTANLTVPQVQRLVDVSHLLWRSLLAEVEADNAQMQTMRIGTIPVRSLLASHRVVGFHLTGIQFLRTTAEVEATQCFVELQVLRIRKAVPPPLTLRT